MLSDNQKLAAIIVLSIIAANAIMNVASLSGPLSPYIYLGIAAVAATVVVWLISQL